MAWVAVLLLALQGGPDEPHAPHVGEHWQPKPALPAPVYRPRRVCITDNGETRCRELH